MGHQDQCATGMGLDFPIVQDDQTNEAGWREGITEKGSSLLKYEGKLRGSHSQYGAGIGPPSELKGKKGSAPWSKKNASKLKSGASKLDGQERKGKRVPGHFGRGKGFASSKVGDAGVLESALQRLEVAGHNTGDECSGALLDKPRMIRLGVPGQCSEEEDGKSHADVKLAHSERLHWQIHGPSEDAEGHEEQRPLEFAGLKKVVMTESVSLEEGRHMPPPPYKRLPLDMLDKRVRNGSRRDPKVAFGGKDSKDRNGRGHAGLEGGWGLGTKVGEQGVNVIERYDRRGKSERQLKARTSDGKEIVTAALCKIAQMVVQARMGLAPAHETTCSSDLFGLELEEFESLQDELVPLVHSLFEDSSGGVEELRLGVMPEGHHRSLFVYFYLHARGGTSETTAPGTSPSNQQQLLERWELTFRPQEVPEEDGPFTEALLSEPEEETLTISVKDNESKPGGVGEGNLSCDSGAEETWRKEGYGELLSSAVVTDSEGEGLNEVVGIRDWTSTCSAVSSQAETVEEKGGDKGVWKDLEWKVLSLDMILLLRTVYAHTRVVKLHAWSKRSSNGALQDLPQEGTRKGAMSSAPAVQSVLRYQASVGTEARRKFSGPVTRVSFGEARLSNGTLSVVSESATMVLASSSPTGASSKPAQGSPPCTPDVHFHIKAPTISPVLPCANQPQGVAVPSCVPRGSSHQSQGEATATEDMTCIRGGSSTAPCHTRANASESGSESGHAKPSASDQLDPLLSSAVDAGGCPSFVGTGHGPTGGPRQSIVAMQGTEASSAQKPEIPIASALLSSNSNRSAPAAENPMLITSRQGGLAAPHPELSPAKGDGSTSHKPELSEAKPICNQETADTLAAQQLKPCLLEAGPAVVVGFQAPSKDSVSKLPLCLPSPTPNPGPGFPSPAQPASPTTNHSSPHLSMHARSNSKQRGLSASLSDSRSHSSSPRASLLHLSSLDSLQLGSTRPQGDCSSPRTNPSSLHSSLSSTPSSGSPVAVCDEERRIAGAGTKESEKPAMRQKPLSPLSHMLAGVGLSVWRETDRPEPSAAAKTSSSHVSGSLEELSSQRALSGASWSSGEGRKGVGVALVIDMAGEDREGEGESGCGAEDLGGKERLLSFDESTRASFSRPGSPSTPPMAIPMARRQHHVSPSASRLTPAAPPPPVQTVAVAVPTRRGPCIMQPSVHAAVRSASVSNQYATQSGGAVQCVPLPFPSSHTVPVRHKAEVRPEPPSTRATAPSSQAMECAGVPSAASSSSPLFFSPFASPVRASGAPPLGQWWPRPAHSPPLSRSPLGPRSRPETPDSTSLLDIGSAPAAYSLGQDALSARACNASPWEASAFMRADSTNKSSPRAASYLLSRCPPSSESHRVFSASPPPPFPLSMGLSPPWWSASLLDGITESSARRTEAPASYRNNQISATGESSWPSKSAEPPPSQSSGTFEARPAFNSRSPASGLEFEACSAPSLGWGPRNRMSGSLKVARPLVGSFEECLLSGRMFSSNAPQRLDGFMALLSVTGKWNVRQQKLPFSVVSVESNNLALYTATIDLGDRAAAASPATSSQSSTGSISAVARAVTKDALAKNRHRVPMKGRVQLVLSNPEKTPVHTFVCKYDLTEMVAGSKTFVRQRILVANGGTPGTACQGVSAGTRGENCEHMQSCRGQSHNGGGSVDIGRKSEDQGTVGSERHSDLEVTGEDCGPADERSGRSMKTASRCLALRRLSYPATTEEVIAHCVGVNLFGGASDKICGREQIARDALCDKGCSVQEQQQVCGESRCTLNRGGVATSSQRSLPRSECVSKDNQRNQGGSGLGSGGLRYALHIRFICCPTKGASDTESLKCRGPHRSRSLGSQIGGDPGEDGMMGEEKERPVGAEDDDALRAKRSRSIDGLDLHKMAEKGRSLRSVKQDKRDEVIVGNSEEGVCRRDMGDGEERGRKFYMYGDIRVVFPQRRSDADEDLQVVYDYPSNPKYFAY